MCTVSPKRLSSAHKKQNKLLYMPVERELLGAFVAAAHQEQQVPDGEQASPSAAGEECHAGVPGPGGERGLLVLHPALLEAPQ